MTQSPWELPLVTRAARHAERVALDATEGVFTYADLLHASAHVARELLDGRTDLEEDRVAFLVPPGFEYVAVQWGVWRAGGVAVPLATSHPEPELAFVLDDAEPVAVIVHPSFERRLAPAARERGIRVRGSDEIVGEPQVVSGEGPGFPGDALPAIRSDRRAMMLYTSGTTGKPKGVVTTHANLEAQVVSLIEAWGWTEEDHTLLVLPLHHVHGIVNVLTCALWAGGRCQILPEFRAEQTWERIGAGDLTLFMAVPTVYAKLIAFWEDAAPPRSEAWAAACRAMRVMVSGSAALPVSTLERWRTISGHTLLERYGMTEIGMALSNPLHGVRRPGFVGRPLPGVEVRLVDDDGTPADPGNPGEIEVRGPTVFLEYWRRPQETVEAFRDGWFRTGDVALVEEGDYRILGRRSVDIIKTGGYKVSALEVEETLRSHSDIGECAVVALADPEWGERVAAAIVPVAGRTDAIDPAEIRVWAKSRMAPYKVPSAFLVVPELPRNAMGKVTKPEIRKLFEADPARVQLL